MHIFQWQVGGCFRYKNDGFVKVITMLTDKVELEATVGIWPEPPFGSIKPSAIFVASGQIPEWNGDSLAIDPFPIFGICGISYGTQPILTIGITLQNDDTINKLKYSKNMTNFEAFCNVIDISSSKSH